MNIINNDQVPFHIINFQFNFFSLDQDIEYRNKVKGKKEIVKDVLGKKMVLPTEDKGLSRD